MRTACLFTLLLLALVGCDGESDTDAGVDAGALDCETTCVEKFTSCSAPPTIAEMQCAAICAENDPTQEQVTCVQDTECPALMEASLGGDPVCDLTFPPPPAPPSDAGTGG